MASDTKVFPGVGAGSAGGVPRALVRNDLQPAWAETVIESLRTRPATWPEKPCCPDPEHIPMKEICMSVAAHAAPAESRPRSRRRAVVATTTMALGAGVLLAPHASAADKYGPGFSTPDDQGRSHASHLGAFGKPSPYFEHAVAHGYCADPTLAGPEAGGQYSRISPFSSWTSMATGKKVAKSDFAAASYVLSRYGETENDTQAAAVDASVTTFLNAGSSYALPGGKRVQERLAYAIVPASVKAEAEGYIAEAKKFAGPYTLSIHEPKHLQPGKASKFTLDVTSASGRKVPGAGIHVAASGAVKAEGNVVADKQGTATAQVKPHRNGEVHLGAATHGLPATTLRAQLPSKQGAQRVVIPSEGTASAKAAGNVTASAQK